MTHWLRDIAQNVINAMLGGNSQPQGTAYGYGSRPTLFDLQKKEIAMKLVSSAENSTLDWSMQYGYIEDIHDDRGYTGGIIGFTSGTGDMLQLVKNYTQLDPENVLAKYIPALQRVNGTDSHEGLGSNFEHDWEKAADDLLFRQAQDDLRDVMYFFPAVQQAIADGLHALGQFIYYDAMVMHGPGDDDESFGGIRDAAMNEARTPAQGGDEGTYLHSFLNARREIMLREEAHEETDRIDMMQRIFVKQMKFDLELPLEWSVYGDKYSIP